MACRARFGPGPVRPGRERAGSRPGEAQRDLAPTRDGVQRGWIEAAAGKFGFYAEGTGPAVAHVMEAIDHERLALAHALGARAVPFAELFHQLGFTTSGQAHACGVYHAIQHSDLIHPIQSPPSSTTATC